MPEESDYLMEVYRATFKRSAALFYFDFFRSGGRSVAQHSVTLRYVTLRDINLCDAW